MMLRTLSTVALRRSVSRFYAAEAKTESGKKLTLTFTCPHVSIFKEAVVEQVSLPTTNGSIGVLAHHVPSIHELTPGLVEVTVNATSKKQLFISGGFATMNPDSTLHVTSIEAFPLDDFSSETISKNVTETQQLLQKAATDVEKAAAEVQLEIFKSLQTALQQKK